MEDRQLPRPVWVFVGREFERNRPFPARGCCAVQISCLIDDQSAVAGCLSVAAIGLAAEAVQNLLGPRSIWVGDPVNRAAAEVRASPGATAFCRPVQISGRITQQG